MEPSTPRSKSVCSVRTELNEVTVVTAGNDNDCACATEFVDMILR